ncbi:MAG: ATPase [Lachnospiraceae bacterium]|nr:ATPase [Lachnospiraceae bacterium]
MDSKLEQRIDDIYSFVESCKMQSFSSTKVVVPKNDLYDLLDDLRRDLPNEIKRYQKILNQRESILEDARKKADNIKSDARAQYGALVEEHVIAQEATRQAELIIQQANAEAERIISEARKQADEIGSGAIYYTADMLNAVEKEITQAYESTVNNSKALETALRGHLEIIAKNKAELGPMVSQRPVQKSKMPAKQGNAPGGQNPGEKGQRSVEPNGQRRK